MSFRHDLIANCRYNTTYMPTQFQVSAAVGHTSRALQYLHSDHLYAVTRNWSMWNIASYFTIVATVRPYLHDPIRLALSHRKALLLPRLHRRRISIERYFRPITARREHHTYENQDWRTSRKARRESLETESKLRILVLLRLTSESRVLRWHSFYRGTSISSACILYCPPCAIQ